MLNTWWRRWQQRKGGTVRYRRPASMRVLLALEQLEDRTLLSISWADAAGGDWNTAGNWSGGALPGASDDVIIKVAGNVTITHSKSITDIVKSIDASDSLVIS